MAGGGAGAAAPNVGDRISMAPKNTMMVGAMNAPNRLALCVNPWAKPRSRRGYHICMARVAPRNAPASPAPRRNRSTAKESPLVANPTAIVTNDR